MAPASYNNFNAMITARLLSVVRRLPNQGAAEVGGIQVLEGSYLWPLLVATIMGTLTHVLKTALLLSWQ